MRQYQKYRSFQQWHYLPKNCRSFRHLWVTLANRYFTFHCSYIDYVFYCPLSIITDMTLKCPKSITNMQCCNKLYNHFVEAKLQYFISILSNCICTSLLLAACSKTNAFVFHQRGSIASYMQVLVLYYSRNVRPSVRLPVRLSHSGTVSKPTKPASWLLHQWRSRRL